jgi:hypothetical protein
MEDMAANVPRNSGLAQPNQRVEILRKTEYK